MQTGFCLVGKENSNYGDDYTWVKSPANIDLYMYVLLISSSVFILVHRAHNITFNGCTFSHLGAAGNYAYFIQFSL